MPNQRPNLLFVIPQPCNHPQVIIEDHGRRYDVVCANPACSMLIEANVQLYLKAG